MHRSVLLIVLLSMFRSAPARADVIDECIQSNAEVQRLRLSGKLLDARDKAIVCSRSGCPSQIQQDCSTWLSELEERIPSVVFEARLGKEARASDVRVFVDGAPQAKNLDGKAMSLDPGRHAFRFERPSAKPISRTLVILEGEKARRIAVEFPGPPLPPKKQTKTSRPIPTAAIVLGAIGVVGGVGFAYFGLDARSRENALRADDCSPRCSKDETDAIERGYVIADVSLGVGVLSLGAASYFFFTRPERTSAVRVTPAAVPIAGGAAAGFHGDF